MPNTSTKHYYKGTKIQRLLVVFTALLLIISLAAVGLGLFVQIELKTFLPILSERTVAVPLLFTIIGALIAGLTILGFVSTFRESYGSLLSYATLLSIGIVLQISAGILVFYYYTQNLDQLKSDSNHIFESYYDNQRPEIRQSWDKLQKENHCCGINSYKDWQKNNQYEHTVPNSCCIHEQCGNKDNKLPNSRNSRNVPSSRHSSKQDNYTEDNHVKNNNFVSDPPQQTQLNPDPDENKNIFKQGCIPYIDHWLRKYTFIILFFGIVIIIVQLITIVLSCYITHHLSRTTYELL